MPLPTSPYWKFRAIEENTIKMLTNKQLWFSHPSKFNDPFDTQINLEHYLEEIRDDIEIKHVNDIILLAKAYLPNHEEYLKSRFLYCANRQEDGFNPFEEVLMWSHYANEHRGICIGLSMDSVRGSLPQTGYFSVDKEVTYGAESFAQETAQYLRFLPSFSLLRDEFNAKHSAPIHNIRTKPLYISRLFDAFSFVKSKNWAYEHEHRLRSGGSTLSALTNVMTETRTYVGHTSATGGFDGYVGLILGTSYRGEAQTIPVPAKEEGAEPILVERVVIKLPNGRTTVVSPEQWDKWFRK